MNQQAAGILAGLFVCILFAIAIGLTLQILFLLNLHRTLNEVRERNREMQPGLVWLNLIPLFNIVWTIITVKKVSNSIEKEYEDRGWRTADEGFARTTGMIWAWGNVASLVLSIIQNAAQFADQAPIAMLISLLSLPVSLAILVCWIMFWVQTHQYKVRLREGGRGYAPGSLEEDYDENPRPRYTEDEYRDNEEGGRGPEKKEDY
jgi:hypothetical protein